MCHFGNFSSGLRHCYKAPLPHFTFLKKFGANAPKRQLSFFVEILKIIDASQNFKKNWLHCTKISHSRHLCSISIFSLKNIAPMRRSVRYDMTNILKKRLCFQQNLPFLLGYKYDTDFVNINHGACCEFVLFWRQSVVF